MKIRVEIESTLEEQEIVIKTNALNEEILELQNAISTVLNKGKDIVFIKNDTEFYFSIDKILFFETEQNRLMAHTIDEEYEVKYKLYELEELLPAYFMRVSKSTILNTRKVYGLTKNLASSSRVDFAKSKKVVYVSRNYYKPLKDMLNSSLRR